VLARSKSVSSSSKDEDAVSEKDPKSVQEAVGSVGTSSSGAVDSDKSPPNIDSADMDNNPDTTSHNLANDVANDFDPNKMYESDSIYNFDLDKMDQPECDDLELLRLHRHNQPVGVWLIAPLITKLQDNCQLKVCWFILETISN
jgi:hypothetical protein